MSTFGILGFSGAMGKPPQQVSSPSSPRRDYSKEIPTDLLIDIFSRLTTEDVARCRCVSKLWSYLLRCPAFYELFQKLSSARPLILFTFIHNGKRLFYSTPQTHPDLNYSHSIPPYYHMGFPIDLGSPEEICPPILGYICTKARKPMICNPSTGEYIVLPTVRNKRTEMKHSFGFSTADELLKVLSVSENYGCRVSTLLSGEVSWRRIECSIPHGPLNVEISINGVLYYLAKRTGNGAPTPYMVVCFYLAWERFKFLAVEGEFVCQSALINCQGKLGLLCANTGGITKHTRSFELLVLEDFNDEVKWSKRVYKLPFYWTNLAVKFLHIVGLTSGGEIVLSTKYLRKPFYMLYINTVTNILVRVEIDFGSVAAFKGVYPKVFTFIDHVENVQLFDCDAMK